MEIVLDETRSYRLTHLYEDVWFYNKRTGQKQFAGEHYGDPEFGLICEADGWCISGGEGVVLCDKDGDLWSAFRFQGRDEYSKPMTFENEAEALLIKNTIKETKLPGYIAELEISDNGEIEIQVDPLNKLASRWRLDVSKMSLRKISG